MSYQVLARKYRPQKFSEVIGQEHVTRTLKNAIAQGRVAHGYIFSGHRGIGKTTIARILAMALNCQSQDHPVPEPCGVCDSCVEIRAGNSVDVIEIDAATNRGIDEIRELREAARYRPARDRFKIYILDEAHQHIGGVLRRIRAERKAGYRRRARPTAGQKAQHILDHGVVGGEASALRKLELLRAIGLRLGRFHARGGGQRPEAVQ